MSEIINAIVPIEAIAPHPRNYKVHPPLQIANLKASHKRFSQYRSVVIWQRPNNAYVQVAGHGILEAMKERGVTHVRADILPEDTPEEDIEGILIADNNLPLGAVDNEELLAMLLQEQQDAGYDLASLGSDDEALRQMLESLGDGYLVSDEQDEGAGGDEFDATPEEGPTRTHVGELWKLGEHRLFVGDCVDPENLKMLMQSEKAAITFTSPPYNVAKNSSLPNKDKYLHDDDKLNESDYLDLLINFTKLALIHSSYVFVNVQSLSGNKIPLIDYLYHFKDRYADTIIWDKGISEPAMAKNVLNSQFEYVHVLSDKANRAIGTKEFRGTLTNVLSMNSRQDKQFSDVHKATFPLAFAQHFVDEFSQKGELVYEPFCGSGTTLIACERARRKCMAIELDPRYADVILKRYEAETNEQAQLLERVEVSAHA